jgi:hypothetical protein
MLANVKQKFKVFRGWVYESCGTVDYMVQEKAVYSIDLIWVSQWLSNF